MIARLSKFLTFSNVIACLALFVALGGSVYAANKINGKQIKKSSLPGNRLKAKTVPGNRLKPNSLTGKQINEKTLTGISAAALTNVQYQSVQAELPSEGRAGTLTANCPPGAYAVGGGATLSNEDRGTVNSSGPSPLRTGWMATGYSYYFFSRPSMTVTAVCVVVDKPGSAVNPGSPQYQPAG